MEALTLRFPLTFDPYGDWVENGKILSAIPESAEIFKRKPPRIPLAFVAVAFLLLPTPCQYIPVGFICFSPVTNAFMTSFLTE